MESHCPFTPISAAYSFLHKKSTLLSIEDELAGMEKAVTQFGRIMRELGVEMFPANTPQAKDG